jgi:CRP/FNR family cyclic AMP-dependent transcriptional regulator
MDNPVANATVTYYRIGVQRMGMTHEDRVSALKQIPILTELSESEVSELLAIAKTVTFQKGDCLFSEGTYGEEVYLIISGAIKVTTTEAQRKTKILNMLNQGDVLGEMAMIDTEYRSATATAHDDAETLAITNSDFLQYIKSHDTMPLKIMKTLSRRLRDANNEIRNFTFYDLAGRLAKVILSLYEKFPSNTDEPLVNLELTHQDLANMLGTARESVTKLISTFKRNGAIDYRGHRIYILDRDELESWIR